MSAQGATLDIHIADHTIDDIQNFLFEHGPTLTFMHPGIIRRHNPDGSSRFITDVFGRFSSGKADNVMVDLNYLDIAQRILNSLPSNIVYDPIKASAGPAIAHAIRDCKTFRPYVTNSVQGLHLTR